MYTISFRTGFFRRKVKVLRHEIKENLHYARAKDSAICMVPAHLIKELIVYADYYTSEAYRAAQYSAPSAPKAPSAPQPAPVSAVEAPEASVSHIYPVDSAQAEPTPPPPSPVRSPQNDPAMQTEIMRRAMARMRQE